MDLDNFVCLRVLSALAETRELVVLLLFYL